MAEYNETRMVTLLTELREEAKRTRKLLRAIYGFLICVFLVIPLVGWLLLVTLPSWSGVQ